MLINMWKLQSYSGLSNKNKLVELNLKQWLNVIKMEHVIRNMVITMVDMKR